MGSLLNRFHVIIVLFILSCLILFFVPVALRPNAVYGLIILRFLDHPQRRTIVDRTPMDERSARRRDLCLTINETHKRETSMHPAGFEPTVSASEMLQNYDSDGAATRVGILSYLYFLGWPIYIFVRNILFNLLAPEFYI
jgi:hypothetical protein